MEEEKHPGQVTQSNTKDPIQPECSICDRTVGYSSQLPPTVQKRTRHKVFHEKCDSCLPVPQHSLCDICKHLRLEHIFRCNPKAFKLDFGTYGELRSRSTCHFCQTIGELIARDPVNVSEDGQLTLKVDPSSSSSHLDIDTPSHWIGLAVICPSSRSTDCYNRKLEVSGEYVSFESIQEWLQRCKADHQECQPPALEPIPSGFRVIDVEKNCIVPLPGEKCAFAALSYVWGRTRRGLTTTNDMLQSLQEEGSLSDGNVSIPNTVSDAIKACRQLRQRYLWVDRLCIAQEEQDSTSTKEQIDAMGRIYNAAEFTIVALTGDDAEHGLPGVSAPRSFTQCRLDCLGIDIVQMLPNIVDIRRDSVWDNRGWTYQEGVLSRRRLFFSETAVYSVCSCLSREEQYIEAIYHWPVATLTTVDDFRYSRAVAEISTRNFTYSTDILRGFAGILTVFFQEKHRFGMSFENFNEAILWRGRVDSELRLVEKPQLEKFPSWSWAKVSGEDQDTIL